ncbi:hypothetical protein ACLB2K_046822 [Fragaria x ananassa]
MERREFAKRKRYGIQKKASGAQRSQREPQSPTASPPIHRKKMATFELYRRSTIGMCLTETLDEMVQNGTLSPELAIQVLVQFDKSMTEALETQVKSKVSIKPPAPTDDLRPATSPASDLTLFPGWNGHQVQMSNNGVPHWGRRDKAVATSWTPGGGRTTENSSELLRCRAAQDRVGLGSN